MSATVDLDSKLPLGKGDVDEGDTARQSHLVLRHPSGDRGAA
jgi:hypothetical protein